MARCSILLALMVASFALAAQAAGGIKGQTKQAPRLAVAPQFIAPQQRAPIPGPGQVSPVFTAAKRPPPPQQPVQQPVQQQQQEPEPVQQQQQQQQAEPSEVDPNAAAQDAAPSLAAPAGPAAAALAAEEANPKPEPYAFNYAFEASDQATSGSSQREEQQDANGRVTGFYTLRGQDGRDRRVDYVADATGFHATISTNEMGTAPKDAADVQWQAQSPTDGQVRAAESATLAARQRALASPTAAAPSKVAAAASAPSPAQAVRTPSRTFAAPVSQQREAAADESLEQGSISQLQEPFEQIRQSELISRARKSRHAPFYLFTV